MQDYEIGSIVRTSWSTTIHASENSFNINNENELLIEEAVEREPGNRDYIDGVIEMYLTVPGENDSEEDFNEFLKDSLTELKRYDAEQDILLEEKTRQAQDNLEVLTPFSTPIMPHVDIKPPANPAYAAARSAYEAGILLVNMAGHWQTANYMKHAIVSLSDYTFNPSWTPSTYVNKNDEWARTVDSTELIHHYYSRMKSEVFSGERESGSWSSSYTFTSGHLLTALRGVNYTITYKRQANRNYWTQIKITDIFDFEWEKNGYDQSIAVGFGNNYAYAMQELGVIKPFKIEIIREIARL